MSQPKSAFKIRPAQSGDGKIIRSLLRSFKLPLDGLNNTKLWVLQSNQGLVIGVAGIEICGKQGLLRSVAVKKDLHCQGYGTLLVNHVTAEAKKSNIGELFLLTTTAPIFFKKLGFQEESREKVADGITESVEFKSACPKTAVLMRLTL